MEREYVAFISYRHKPLDMAVAKKLHSLIERYRIPRSMRREHGKRLGIAFRDQEELPVSGNLSEDICEALDHAEFLVVICTPDTPKSHWVAREIEYFLEHHEAHRALAVLAAGAPEEAFPYGLTHIGKDPVREVEPLAANIVADTEKQSLKKLKKESIRLFAAMLGCPYDSLAQRENRRKRRRLAAGLSVGAAVLLGYAGIMMRDNQIILGKNRELESANRTLTEQKEQLQLNESVLLTEEADRAAADGDLLTAAERAAAALPEEDNDRPYYAPAERALLGALEVFDADQSGHALIARQDTRLNATVLSAVPMPDGKAVILLDKTGRLYALDPYAGAFLWQKTLDTLTDFNTDLSSSADPVVRVNAVNGSLLVLHRERLLCISPQSGELLWETGKGHEAARFTLSADGTRIAYTDRNSQDIFAWTYDLAVLDAANGTETARIPFPGTDGLQPFAQPYHGGAEREKDSASFSEDNALFTGVYYEKTGDGKTAVHYIADLKEGSMRTVARESVGEEAVLRQDLKEDGEGRRLLYVLTQAKDSPQGVTGKVLDAESGETLWEETALPPETDPYTSPWEVRNETAVSHAVTAVTADRYCYLFRFGARVLQGSVQLPDTVIRLFPESKNVLCAVTADGEYTPIWPTAYGAAAGTSIGLNYDIGASVTAAEAKNGFILSERGEDGGLIGFNVGTPEEGFGYIVTVPADDPRSVSVRHVRVNEGIPEKTVYRQEQDRSFMSLPDGQVMHAFADGSLLLAESGKEETFWYVIDPASGETLYSRHAADADSSGALPLLKDNPGLLLTDPAGEIRRITEDGEELLAQREERTLGTGSGGMSYRGSAAAAVSVLLPDRTLLTARCDGNALSLWKDGGPWMTEPLPAGTEWEHQDALRLVHLLTAGENGCVLIGSFESGNTGNIDHFLLFDPEARAWTELPDAARGRADRRIIPGKAAKTFAVVEEGTAVRVYRPGAEDSPVLLNTATADGQVASGAFFAEDRYLALCAKDGILEIYSAETGERMYLGELEEASYECEGIAAATDPEGRRLYVTETRNRTGKCISLLQWTDLGDLRDVRAYLPGSNELLYERYASSGRELVTHPVPSLRELEEKARKLLTPSSALQ